MAYQKTVNVRDGIDDMLAAQYNDLRAEVKAAVEGFMLSSDVDLTIAYNEDGTINTITGTDEEGDSNLDIDYVATFAYTDGVITSMTVVFSKLGITLTETYGYTDGKLTSVGRALS